MGQDFKIPEPIVAIKALVRDGDGHPKFDDLSKIAEFSHLLTDDDKTYLENKYGKGIFDN